jgi:ferritin-like protein
MNRTAIERLEACRVAEKEQALYYRALAAAAEDRSDEVLSERLQQLHADEQHHLSRVTARLLELGCRTPDLAHVRAEVPALEQWEADAQSRELAEVRRYEELLDQELDPPTAALAEKILEVERAHARELGGKWTMA